MITLNKWRQKCLDKINRQFRISEFSNIKLYSAILSGMFRRVDDELEMARKETTLRMRDVHLKRMQEQLMEMFYSAPDHILSKEAICAALWPKKDNPETTLYTFICRLKSTLKTQSDMDIINKRGKEYQLRKNPTTN